MFKHTAFAALTSFPLALFFANGVFQTVSGDVRSSVVGAPSVATPVNSRIVEGTTVTMEPTVARPYA